jgi:membrane-bound lytic murein transglycosylase D
MFGKKKIYTLIFLWFIASLIGYATTDVAEERAPMLAFPEYESSMYTFDTAIEEMCVAWRQHIKTRETCDSAFRYKPLSYSHDSIRIKRLSMMPTIMEMTYNDVVSRYINMYCDRNRQISYMMALSQHYFPIFETIFEQYNLPTELKYLSIVESALNPRATSRMGAAGLWQFMPTTGKLYNLEINSLYDERRDPIKSTHAAAQHFNDLYSIFQDWNLVIAAYNCGTGNVNKAIRRAGGKKDYWEIYPFLPTETRNYVPAFIAVNYMMHYADAYNICPAIVDMPLVTDTIHITQRVHLLQVAEVLDIPIEQVRQLNPSYKRDIIPHSEKAQFLRLPSHLAYLFIEKQDSIYAYKNYLSLQRVASQPSMPNCTTTNTSIHTVRTGENLSLIANRYGVTVSQLMKWNNLTTHSLRVGQRIYVKDLLKSDVYEVKKGDSIWTIARNTGVSVEKIKLANTDKNLQVLQPGLKLAIPKN